MIKFRAGNLIGLGLSKMNIKKLKEGQPILVKGADIGVENDILVMYGDTEKSMEKQLRDAGMLRDKTH